VLFSEPRTRLSRFAFAFNSFVALEQTLFVDFTTRKDLLRSLPFVSCRQRLESAPQISQGSHKGHYVRLLLLRQLPIEHEIKIFYRVLQREEPAVM
jgi:hypothetical protein